MPAMHFISAWRSSDRQGREKALEILRASVQGVELQEQRVELLRSPEVKGEEIQPDR